MKVPQMYDRGVPIGEGMKNNKRLSGWGGQNILFKVVAKQY